MEITPEQAFAAAQRPSVEQAVAASRRRRPPVRVSGLVAGLVIADLLLCAARAVLTLLSGYAVFKVGSLDAVGGTLALMVVIGLGIGLCGVPGNVLILTGRRAGVVLGIVSAALTAVHILVSVWLVDMVSDVSRSAMEESPGFSAGAIAGISVRVAMVVLYMVALVWADRQLSRSRFQPLSGL